MKHLLIVFCMIFSVMVSPAFAPTDDEFDYTGFTEDEELDTFDNYTIEIEFLPYSST